MDDRARRLLVAAVPLSILAAREKAGQGTVGPLRGRAGSPAGRNDPCPCGSGRKRKKCCRERQHATTKGA